MEKKQKKTATFYSYIDPIKDVVDRYYEKKRAIAKNDASETGEPLAGDGEKWKGELPDSPETFLRDEKGRVDCIIYGDVSELENTEEDPLIWQEEFVRNTAGTVTAIRTTYPDGSVVEERFVRDAAGHVTEIRTGGGTGE